MASGAPFPPPDPESVFTVVAERHIHAPIDTIWNLWMDMSTWPEWNPFIVKGEVVERAKDDPTPADEQEREPLRIKLGMLLRFHRAEGGTSRDRVTELDESNPKLRHVAWLYEDLSPRLLNVLRITEVEEISPGECVFRTAVHNKGLLVRLHQWLYAKKLKRWFEDSAEGIKVAAEKQSGHSSSS